MRRSTPSSRWTCPRPPRGPRACARPSSRQNRSACTTFSLSLFLSLSLSLEVALASQVSKFASRRERQDMGENTGRRLRPRFLLLLLETKARVYECLLGFIFLETKDVWKCYSTRARQDATADRPQSVSRRARGGGVSAAHVESRGASVQLCGDIIIPLVF